MFGECHAHALMNGVNYREAVALHREKANEEAVRQCLRAYQEAEVSFVRDGGDPMEWQCWQQNWPRNMGLIIGHLFFAIHRNGHYGEIVGHGFDNLKEFHGLVLKAGEEGADFIKIMTTGLLDFKNHGKVTGEPLEAEEVKEMVHIAHEEGFAVMSHTNGVYGTRAAIEAGVDSLEHGNYMDEETLSMLADSDTVWVPTLVTVRNLLGCGRYDDEVLRPIIARSEELVHMAFEKKIKTAAGSDAGAYMVPHGKGICQEYESFCQILGNIPRVTEWLKMGKKKSGKDFVGNKSGKWKYYIK